MYADGSHDSLYRSGGVTLLAEPALAPVVPIRPGLTAAEPVRQSRLTTLFAA